MAVSRVQVAYGSNWNDTTPTFTRIDNPSGIRVVSGWRVHRGRDSVRDKMTAGTAEVMFKDVNGVLDPTNTTGPFFPMDPNCPISIEMINPVTEVFRPIYYGLIQDCPQVIRFGGAPVNQGQLNCIDMLSILAIKEVPPGLDFDDSPDGTSTANTTGDTTYAQQTVQDRLKSLCADSGVPSALTTIFTGNIYCPLTVYSPGYKILAAMQDAAEAEYPGTAVLYVDKSGILTFHGRLARFDSGPGNPYGISNWRVGDALAVAEEEDTASLYEIEIDRDVNQVINNGLFTPQGCAPEDVAGQLTIDASSITQFGPRGISGLELKNAGGTIAPTLGDPLAECKQFSDFYVSNFEFAQNRVKRAVLRAIPLNRPNSTYHWNMVCNVELNDVVSVTTTHPGGGGFSLDPYFVEGITYELELGPSNIPNVTLTLDLSSKQHFVTEPWEHPG